MPCCGAEQSNSVGLPRYVQHLTALYFIIAETQCNCKRNDANARFMKHILLLYLSTASPLFSIEPSNIIESSGEI